MITLFRQLSKKELKARNNKIIKLHNEGIKPVQIASRMGMAKTTVYGVLRKNGFRSTGRNRMYVDERSFKRV